MPGIDILGMIGMAQKTVMDTLSPLVPKIELPKIELPQLPFTEAPAKLTNQSSLSPTTVPKPFVSKVIPKAVTPSKAQAITTMRRPTVAQVTPKITLKDVAKELIPTPAKGSPAGRHLAELVLNAKYGTDFNDPRLKDIDPYGKYFARLGSTEELGPYADKMREVFMRDVWSRKQKTEEFIGDALRRSPVRGSKELLTTLQAARDVLGYDIPENVVADILPDLITLGYAKSAKVPLSLLRAGKTGDTMSLQGIKRAPSLVDDFISGVRRSLSQINVPKKVTPTPSAPTPRPSAPAPKTRPTTPPVRPTPQPPKYRAPQQRVVLTRKAPQPTRSVPTPEVRAPMQRLQMQAAGPTRLDDLSTRVMNDVDSLRLSLTDQLAPKLDESVYAVRSALDDLADSLKRTTPSGSTSSFWDKLKYGLYGAGGGAAAMLGISTLGGVLAGDEGPTNPGTLGPKLNPDQVLDPNEVATGETGGAWGDWGGYQFWQPSPDELSSLPPSVIDDLGNGGFIGYDSDGDPWGIYDAQGSLIRELSESEKQALAAMTEQYKPASLKTRDWLTDHWLFLVVAGLTVTGIAWYIYEERKKRGTGYNMVKRSRRYSSWI